MKKILFSLMAIALVVGLVGAGAFAWFVDTETSTDNTFTAGILDLTVDGADDPAVVAVSYPAMAPGDTTADGWLLDNVGSIDGDLRLAVLQTEDLGNGLEEPEFDTPPDGDDAPGEGELDSALRVVLAVDYDADGSVWADANHNGVVESSELDGTYVDVDGSNTVTAGDTVGGKPLLYVGFLDNIQKIPVGRGAGGYDAGTLAGDGVGSDTVMITLDTSIANLSPWSMSMMGDSAKINITFRLDQS